MTTISMITHNMSLKPAQRSKIRTWTIGVPGLILCFHCAFMILAIASCTQPAKYNINLTRKSINIAETASYLYSMFPNNMTLEEKCKIYAVASSLAGSKDPLRREVDIDIVYHDKQRKQRYYNEINPVDLGPLFMNAIDGFRLSQLEPALIEIIECLRHVDTLGAKTYLEDKELKIISELYHRVIQSPDPKIDLRAIDLSKFHPAFEASLRHLFRKYLADSGSQFNADQNVSDASRSEASYSDQFQTSYRMRELERLRNHRRRVMQPEAYRESNRLKSMRWRRRMRQEEEQQRRLRRALIEERIAEYRKQFQQPKSSYASASDPPDIYRPSPYGLILSGAEQSHEISQHTEFGQRIFDMLESIRAAPVEAAPSYLPSTAFQRKPFQRHSQVPSRDEGERVANISRFGNQLSSTSIQQHPSASLDPERERSVQSRRPTIRDYIMARQPTDAQGGPPDMSMMTILRPPPPSTDEIETDSDSTIRTNQFEDTDIVMQSFIKHTPSE